MGSTCTSRSATPKRPWEPPTSAGSTYRTLLGSFLYLFGRDAILEGIHFFTAVPEFLYETDPAAILRFREHLEALRETGVRVHLAAFKRKTLTCPQCRDEIDRYEEKETDVALGVKAMELLYLNACDTLVIVSGDTDFAPAMRTAKRLFPAVQVCVAFPHARFNAELQQIADFSFRIRLSLLQTPRFVGDGHPEPAGVEQRPHDPVPEPGPDLVPTWSRPGPSLS